MKNVEVIRGETQGEGRFDRPSYTIRRMWQRFPPRMRRALVSALDEAARSGREAADVEDLFTVIAGDRESAGAYLLEQCSVDVQLILNRDDAPSLENPPAGQRARHRNYRQHQPHAAQQEK